jgi:hypothetical protein
MLTNLIGRLDDGLIAQILEAVAMCLTATNPEERTDAARTLATAASNLDGYHAAMEAVTVWLLKEPVPSTLSGEALLIFKCFFGLTRKPVAGGIDAFLSDGSWPSPPRWEEVVVKYRLGTLAKA